MLPSVKMHAACLATCWGAWLDMIPARPASQRAVQHELTCMLLQWCCLQAVVFHQLLHTTRLAGTHAAPMGLACTPMPFLSLLQV